MKLWTRLWGWLERHLPDLTGDCGTDDEEDMRAGEPWADAALVLVIETTEEAS